VSPLISAFLEATPALMWPAFSLWGSVVTWTEVLACALSVWMVICNLRVQALGWPLAMLSSLLYGGLFVHYKLYGEAGLQIFFVLVAGWGWWQWVRGVSAGNAHAGVRWLTPGLRAKALLATLPPTSHPGDSGPGGSARPSPFAAPLQRLARQDVDLRVTMGEVRSGGAVYHDAAAHLLLTAGRLVVDQVSATLPGGRMEGRVSIGLDDDAAVRLALHAPGLAALPLLTALGIGQSEYKGVHYWDRTTVVADHAGVVKKVYEKVNPQGHEQVLLADHRQSKVEPGCRRRRQEAPLQAENGEPDDPRRQGGERRQIRDRLGREPMFAQQIC
jgi:hypothetical protein